MFLLLEFGGISTLQRDIWCTHGRYNLLWDDTLAAHRAGNATHDSPLLVPVKSRCIRIYPEEGWTFRSVWAIVGRTAMSALPCPVADRFAAADQTYATITEFLRSEEARQVKPQTS